jgi:hypothetical protein
MVIDDIQGWFTWQWLYKWAARNSGYTAHVPTFVEVGVWKGKSIAYLCQQLMLVYGTRFRLIAVDTWQDGLMAKPENMAQNAFMPTGVDALYFAYRRNMLELGLEGRIHDYRMPSVEAARLVDHADFVFIDADHSADAVAVDVRAWASKANVLCGHDVCQSSVREGLQRSLGQQGVNWWSLSLLDCWTTSPGLAEEWALAAKVQCSLAEQKAIRLVEWFHQEFHEELPQHESIRSAVCA